MVDGDHLSGSVDVGVKAVGDVSDGNNGASTSGGMNVDIIDIIAASMKNKAKSRTS